MSESADDAEISRLQHAASFMHEVRLAQAGSNKTLQGRTRISQEQKHAITEAVENSDLVAEVKKLTETDLPVNTLAERFEEMARRNGMAVDAELRPSLVKLLAMELCINHIALGSPAEGLMSATLHQGAIAPELLKEFPQHPTYLITQAMHGNPASSRDFLHWLGEEVAAISAEPEFELLARNRPSEFAHSALQRRSDVREKLRRTQEALKKDHWVGLDAKREPENKDKRR